MSHTAGPWFTNRQGLSTVYIEARIGRGILQEVAACGPTEKGGEQEANARLIAAAPDLLAALERLIPLLEHDVGGKAGSVLHDARAAIAMATQP